MLRFDDPEPMTPQMVQKDAPRLRVAFHDENRQALSACLTGFRQHTPQFVRTASHGRLIATHANVRRITGIKSHIEIFVIF